MVLLPEDDGTLGKIMVSTETGQELLEQAFISTTVTSRFLPPAPQTFVTPEWVYSQFSKPLAYLPTPAHEFDSPSNPRNEADNLTNDVEGFEEAALSEQLGAREWLGHASPVQTSNQAPEQASLDGMPRHISEPVAVDASLIRVAQAEPQQHPSSSPLAADEQPHTTTNQAPVVVRPIADASNAEDAIFSYDISGSFADADAVDGDSLTFSATSEWRGAIAGMVGDRSLHGCARRHACQRRCRQHHPRGYRHGRCRRQRHIQLSAHCQQHQ